MFFLAFREVPVITCRVKGGGLHGFRGKRVKISEITVGLLIRNENFGSNRACRVQTGGYAS